MAFTINNGKEYGPVVSAQSPQELGDIIADSLWDIDRKDFVQSGDSYFYTGDHRSSKHILYDRMKVTGDGWSKEGKEGKWYKSICVNSPDIQLYVMDKVGEKNGMKLRFGKLKEYMDAIGNKKTHLDMRNTMYHDMVFTNEIISQENGSYVVREYGGYELDRGVIRRVPGKIVQKDFKPDWGFYRDFSGRLPDKGDIKNAHEMFLHIRTDGKEEWVKNYRDTDRFSSRVLGYDPKWEKAIVKDFDALEKMNPTGFFGDIDFKKTKEYPVHLRFSDRADVVIVNKEFDEFFPEFTGTNGDFKLSFWTDEKPGK